MLECPACNTLIPLTSITFIQSTPHSDESSISITQCPHCESILKLSTTTPYELQTISLPEWEALSDATRGEIIMQAALGNLISKISNDS